MSLQVNVQCTPDLAAAILDLLLPVTSDNVDNMDDRFSWSSDLGIMWVAIEISTIYSIVYSVLYTVYSRLSGCHLGFISPAYFQQRWQYG